jgi:hypothetical protein
MKSYPTWVVEFLPKHLLEPHNHADYFAVMTSRFQKKILQQYFDANRNCCPTYPDSISFIDPVKICCFSAQANALDRHPRPDAVQSNIKTDRKRSTTANAAAITSVPAHIPRHLS